MVANTNTLILKIHIDIEKKVEMPDRHPKCLLSCLAFLGSSNIGLNR